MSLVNEVRIFGRVATEPQQNGKGPFKFRLAHGGGSKRKDGTPWPTQWFSVSCWDAKVMAGIAKGDRVEIFGKLRDSSFTAQDGTKKYGVEIVADAIVVEGAEPQTAPLATGGIDTARAILRPAGVRDAKPL